MASPMASSSRLVLAAFSATARQSAPSAAGSSLASRAAYKSSRFYAQQAMSGCAACSPRSFSSSSRSSEGQDASASTSTSSSPVPAANATEAAAAPTGQATQSIPVVDLDAGKPEVAGTSQAQASGSQQEAAKPAEAVKPTASSASSTRTQKIRLPSEPVSQDAALNQSVRPGYTADDLPHAMNPLLATIIGILQKDGKKARAMRQLSQVLQHLTAAVNGDPMPILTAAVTRASPLVRMQSRKQGGKSIQVPLPLNERQSTRRGIVAILDASKKRNDADLSVRVAKEIIAVVEGTSSVLQKKEEAHKIALINRANASVRI